MGHEVIFIMHGGNMTDTFNVWFWEKNGSILHEPQVWSGNECLVIGNWSAN
jgi:anti-sigma factor ChrR (cupin superfamily)